jgi:membrane associated rhomboid family serine protease
MVDPLETILRECAQAAPEPWYPSGYAQANGMRRDDLDPHLDQLRMAGLIQLTDWVQGRGQGYALTPGGRRVLESPRELARVRAGILDHSGFALQEPPKRTQQRMTAFERSEEIRAAFLYPSTPVVSYGLILINIAWFLWGISIALQHGEHLNQFLYGSTDQVLRQTGALSGYYLVQSWWGWGRLITCCFVHIGLLHLGVNMYSLWVVGPFFEQLWGRMRFLVLYLIAGLGGSCAMVINNPHILGAGASGALWGIFAAYAVWVILNRRYLPGPMASRMLRQVIIVFAINVAITYGVPNISAAAHFGGGAVGAITALLLHWQRYGLGLLRRLALLGLIAVPVMSIAAVAEAQDLDPRWQEAKIAFIARQAQQILDADAQPFLGRKLKVHSLKEVKNSISHLETARTAFVDFAKQLQRIGTIRSKEVEEKRQELIQELKRDSSVCAVAQLDNYIGPYIADARRLAQLTYDRQWKILQERQAGGNLTPEEVERIIAPCREAREDMEAGVALLSRAGPYPEDRIEKRKRIALHLEEARLQGWKDTEQRWRDKAKPAK